MRLFAIFLLLSSALSLVACSKTGNAGDGAGFELLRPSPETRAFVIANDIDFARQIVGHNKTCQAQAGCRK